MAEQDTTGVGPEHRQQDKRDVAPVTRPLPATYQGMVEHITRLWKTIADGPTFQNALKDSPLPLSIAFPIALTEGQIDERRISPYSTSELTQMAKDAQASPVGENDHTTFPYGQDSISSEVRNFLREKLGQITLGELPRVVFTEIQRLPPDQQTHALSLIEERMHDYIQRLDNNRKTHLGQTTRRYIKAVETARQIGIGENEIERAFYPMELEELIQDRITSDPVVETMARLRSLRLATEMSVPQLYEHFDVSTLSSKLESEDDIGEAIDEMPREPEFDRARTAITTLISELSDDKQRASLLKKLQTYKEGKEEVDAEDRTELQLLEAAIYDQIAEQEDLDQDEVDDRDPSYINTRVETIVEKLSSDDVSPDVLQDIVTRLQNWEEDLPDSIPDNSISHTLSAIYKRTRSKIIAGSENIGFLDSDPIRTLMGLPRHTRLKVLRNAIEGRDRLRNLGSNIDSLPLSDKLELIHLANRIEDMNKSAKEALDNIPEEDSFLGLDNQTRITVLRLSGILSLENTDQIEELFATRTANLSSTAESISRDKSDKVLEGVRQVKQILAEYIESNTEINDVTFQDLNNTLREIGRDLGINIRIEERDLNTLRDMFSESMGEGDEENINSEEFLNSFRTRYFTEGAKTEEILQILEREEFIRRIHNSLSREGDDTKLSIPYLSALNLDDVRPLFLNAEGEVDIDKVYDITGTLGLDTTIDRKQREALTYGMGFEALTREELSQLLLAERLDLLSVNSERAISPETESARNERAKEFSLFSDTIVYRTEYETWLRLIKDELEKESPDPNIEVLGKLTDRELGDYWIALKLMGYKDELEKLKSFHETTKTKAPDLSTSEKEGLTERINKIEVAIAITQVEIADGFRPVLEEQLEDFYRRVISTPAGGIIPFKKYFGVDITDSDEVLVNDFLLPFVQHEVSSTENGNVGPYLRRENIRLGDVIGDLTGSRLQLFESTLSSLDTTTALSESDKLLLGSAKKAGDLVHILTRRDFLNESRLFGTQTPKYDIEVASNRAVVQTVVDSVLSMSDDSSIENTGRVDQRILMAQFADRLTSDGLTSSRFRIQDVFKSRLEIEEATRVWNTCGSFDELVDNNQLGELVTPGNIERLSALSLGPDYEIGQVGRIAELMDKQTTDPQKFINQIANELAKTERRLDEIQQLPREHRNRDEIRRLQADARSRRIELANAEVAARLIRLLAADAWKLKYNSEKGAWEPARNTVLNNAMNPLAYFMKRILPTEYLIKEYLLSHWNNPLRFPGGAHLLLTKETSGDVKNWWKENADRTFDLIPNSVFFIPEPGRYARQVIFSKEATPLLHEWLSESGIGTLDDDGNIAVGLEDLALTDQETDLIGPIIDTHSLSQETHPHLYNLLTGLNVGSIDNRGHLVLGNEFIESLSSRGLVSSILEHAGFLTSDTVVIDRNNPHFDYFWEDEIGYKINGGEIVIRKQDIVGNLEAMARLLQVDLLTIHYSELYGLSTDPEILNTISRIKGKSPRELAGTRRVEDLMSFWRITLKNTWGMTVKLAGLFGENGTWKDSGSELRKKLGGIAGQAFNLAHGAEARMFVLSFLRFAIIGNQELTALPVTKDLTEEANIISEGINDWFWATRLFANVRSMMTEEEILLVEARRKEKGIPNPERPFAPGSIRDSLETATGYQEDKNLAIFDRFKTAIGGKEERRLKEIRVAREQAQVLVSTFSKEQLAALFHMKNASVDEINAMYLDMVEFAGFDILCHTKSIQGANGETRIVIQPINEPVFIDPSDGSYLGDPRFVLVEAGANRVFIDSPQLAKDMGRNDIAQGLIEGRYPNGVFLDIDPNKNLLIQRYVSAGKRPPIEQDERKMRLYTQVIKDNIGFWGDMAIGASGPYTTFEAYAIEESDLLNPTSGTLYERAVRFQEAIFGINVISGLRNRGPVNVFSVLEDPIMTAFLGTPMPFKGITATGEKIDIPKSIANGDIDAKTGQTLTTVPIYTLPKLPARITNSAFKQQIKLAAALHDLLPLTPEAIQASTGTLYPGMYGPEPSMLFPVMEDFPWDIKEHPMKSEVHVPTRKGRKTLIINPMAVIERSLFPPAGRLLSRFPYRTEEIVSYHNTIAILFGVPRGGKVQAEDETIKFLTKHLTAPLLRPFVGVFNLLSPAFRGVIPGGTTLALTAYAATNVYGNAGQGLSGWIWAGIVSLATITGISLFNRISFGGRKNPRNLWQTIAARYFNVVESNYDPSQGYSGAVTLPAIKEIAKKINDGLI